MSATERRLWQRLRKRQVLGWKFRRQHPIGPYFADVACIEAGLIVEVDGDHHAVRATYDAGRDAFLHRQGYQVIRFWASEVDENVEGIIEGIASVLRSSTPRPPPNPPPRAGEEG